MFLGGMSLVEPLFGVTLNVTSCDNLGRYMGDMPRNENKVPKFLFGASFISARGSVSFSKTSWPDFH